MFIVLFAGLALSVTLKDHFPPLAPLTGFVNGYELTPILKSVSFEPLSPSTLNLSTAGGESKTFFGFPCSHLLVIVFN